MRATVKKIHPLKTSRNHNSFIRVEFQLENGDWVKTDLCPDYRNFARWREILRLGVGTVVSNVQMHPKRKNEINADSYPSISHEPLKPQERPKPVVSQGPLFADYPPPQKEPEIYEGPLSKCCAAPMLEGSGQCVACGAPPEE